MNKYIKLIIFIIFLIIITKITNYYNYNDTILYGKTNITRNDEELFTLLNKYGRIKDPNKIININSCKLFQFNDIANYCNQYIEKFYNKNFLNKIANMLDISNLYYIDPIIDPLAFVIQLYQEGNYMSYHYDTNYTSGKRFTVVIPLYYNKYNTSYLYYIDKNSVERKVNLPLGKFVLYNGDNLLHQVSKQSYNGKRISLVINLTTDPSYSIYGSIMQYLRNLMFKVFIV